MAQAHGVPHPVEPDAPVDTIVHLHDNFGCGSSGQASGVDTYQGSDGG